MLAIFKKVSLAPPHPSPILLALVFLSFLLSSPPVHAASQDGNIEWAGLFHDQGDLFDNNPEPKANSTVTLRFRAYKNDLTAAEIKYWDADKQSSKSLPMTRQAAALSPVYDYWEGTLPVGTTKSSYRFRLKDGDTTVWYNALGPSAAEAETADFELIPDFNTPTWLKNAVIYQIFLDRFYNGDATNDVTSGEYSYAGKPTIKRSWGASPMPAPNESPSMIFYGGDLDGLLAKLKYVTEDLGANVVYLNPIFTSPSNHKYDTSDYDSVDKHFGSLETLKTLSAKLHSLPGADGHLLLDGVFNHTGDSHYWFNKYNNQENYHENYKETYKGQKQPGAYQSLSSPFRNYYAFSKWPSSYATFLDVKELPKLNYNSTSLRSKIYLAPDSVAQRYIRPPFAIDGWRLDAPMYADGGLNQGSDDENHIIWQEFRAAVKKCAPDAAILGEYWGDASSWTSGGEWDSVTNFEGFTKPASEWITGKSYSGDSVSMSVSELDNWLRVTRAHYPTNVQQCLSNHLSNHDISRFAERADGDHDKIALALYFQMTYVGAPTIYYGDEYGMRGATDPDDRRCFDWSKGTINNDLVALTHKLIGIRKKYSALRTGSFVTIKCDDTNKIYAFGRMDKHNKIAVILNNDSSAHDVQIAVTPLDVKDVQDVQDAKNVQNSSYREAVTDQLYESHGGSLSIKVPAHRGLILVNEQKD